jgi:hypothetical protein
MAEARYKGAQTQLLQNQQQNRSTLQTILGGDPNAMYDPGTRAKAYTAIQGLPADEQNAARANFGVWMQNSNLPQGDKDHFITAAGIQPFPQTDTGQGRALQNQIQTATIGAGPGYAQAGATVEAAKIGAAGRIAEEQTRVAGAKALDDDSLVPVITPTGVTTATKKQARDYGLTMLPANATPADVATTIVSHEQPGQAPLNAPPPPSHGVSPGPDATQPQTDPSGAPVSPGTAATTAITKVQGTNVPKEDPAVTLQKIANNDLVRGYWASDPKTNPQGNFTVGPRMQAAILARANQLTNDRSTQFYGNQVAAMVQAWNELVTPIKNDPSKLGYNTGYSWMPWTKSDQPVVDFTPNYTPPPPPPLNPRFSTQPAPTQPATAAPAAPLPRSNRAQIAPPPAPNPANLTPKPALPAKPKTPAAAAGPTPAPAQGASGQKPELSAIPAEMRKPGVVYHGSIFVGGDPRQGSNWRVATPDEIANAKQNGLLAQ